MYKQSGKVKLFSIVLIVIGALGIGYGFLTTPSTTDEVKEILAAEHHGGHGNDHAMADEESHHGAEMNSSGHTEKHVSENEEHHGEEAHGAASEEDHHLEHVLHQMQTKPWSATFVAAFFFLMIALGVLAFYAIQYVAQVGWSPVLFRVMEGITAYVLPGSLIVLGIVLFAGEHFYPWQNHELVAEDKILQDKSGYLNFPFFVIRAIVYILIWNTYRFFAVRNSRSLDNASDIRPYKKNFKISVAFLLLFMITESTMAWDWFMSMTPHWYSTLFAWYIFATMIVSALTVISITTIILKRAGFLPEVNDSHLHDVAKFMFGFSVFWTYLWFSQFMLIWYANIPEEVTYFTMRIQEYNLLFFGMVVINFVFPILILMNSDFKRIPWLVIIAGCFILVGHYIDVYLLVMPSTVGAHWSFGITEFAAILFFLGLFLLVVGIGLGSAPLRIKNNPFLKESENYHY
jgi:hypothetical protein